MDSLCHVLLVFHFEFSVCVCLSSVNICSYLHTERSRHVQRNTYLSFLESLVVLIGLHLSLANVRLCFFHKKLHPKLCTLSLNGNKSRKTKVVRGVV